jgi:hypothetical protein
MGYPKLPSAMLGSESVLLNYLLIFYIYPVPLTTILQCVFSPAGMILVNTFEEIFGDIQGQRDQDVWCLEQIE